MNNISYNIYEDVYNSIINNNKTIEIRLYNDKSKNIKIGDIITFKVLDNEEKFVKVCVIDLIIYDNVDDLIKRYDKRISTNRINKDNIKGSLYNIFGEDNVRTSKFIGIVFKLI